jgi:outer membrane biosynthesis protein TonB
VETARLAALLWGVTACGAVDPAPPDPPPSSREVAAVAPAAAPTATAEATPTPSSSALPAARFPSGPWSSEQPEIRAFMGPHLGVLRRKCLYPALEREPDLAKGGAKILVVLEAAADGTLTRVTATSEKHPALADCVKGVVERWMLPPSDAGGTLTFPVIFLSKG